MVPLMKPGDHPEFFQFPAPPGQSRESTIRLDADGHFWHDDERFENPRMSEAFHGWIRRHPDDRRYILSNGYDWTYFVVDDTPFFVNAVRVEPAGVRLLLSNGDEVPLEGLNAGPDGSLYAPVTVRGDRYEARFSRHAQTQLDPALVEKDGVVGVQSGDQFLVPGERPPRPAAG